MHIPLEDEYRKEYHSLVDQVIDSGYWSQGSMQRRFEDEFEGYVGLGSRCFSNGGSALLSIFSYLGVEGKDVVVPSNTFWATSMAAQLAGANVIYADCNRDDLCLSLDDLKRKVTPQTKVVCVVHIGGHIAFEIDAIADYCEKNNIYLVEDCAHVHGGWWHGKTGGHWGFAGAYSFYATKTMPMGEGGMVVSKNADFLEWSEKFRNYGKVIVDNVVTYPIKNGFNYRISEFTAALGIVQLKRLPLILKWKKELAAKYDEIFTNRISFPEGMQSGYYKYIVFDCPELIETSGQVFGPLDLGHVISNSNSCNNNSEWISKNHYCVPIWYGWPDALLSTNELRSKLLPK